MGLLCSCHKKRLLKLSVEPMSQLQLRMCSTTTACENQFHGNNGISTPLRHIKTLCQPSFPKETHRLLQLSNGPIESLTKDCIQKRDLSQSELTHVNKNGKGFSVDRISANAIVNMYVKCGSLRHARKVFDEMPQRNVRSWTIMIAAYARQGRPKEALDLFDQMQSSGVQPNQFTFSAVLPACSSLVSQTRGLEIHEQILSSGFQCDTVIQTTLIDMYAKFGNMVKARELFDEMPHLDVFSCTAMIAGYAQNGQQQEALAIFRRMEMAGLKADVKTLACVLPACSNLTALKNGMEVHGVIIRRETRSGVIVESALVDMYANCGSIETARKLFNNMPQRDVLSWTVMIKGCAQNGEAGEALKLFEQMERAGAIPNQKTFTTVLSACANLAALEKGMDIHEKIARLGLELDVCMLNSLIDMYAKCGRIEKARELFDEMHERDVTTWTSMISGYAINGRGKEALILFEEMKQSCTSPNHVTMLCVLSACAHAGLVEQGYQYFDCLSKFYHIQPTMEHYCCMVDLLGRAGRLDEAQDFINKMPIKPDATLWTCLLGACAIYNHIELGERLAGFLFEMDPHSPPPYVLLSNIYAAAGRWDDAEKIWKMMKEKGVKKTPGCSWIEVNKQVHAFLIQDRSRH